MKRGKENLILVTNKFGLGVGGIQTYLKNIVKYWDGTVSVFSKKMDLDNSFSNLFEIKDQKKHILLIYHYFLRLLINKNKFIKSLKLFLLLVINRNIAIKTYNKIFSIYKQTNFEFEDDTKNTIICSLLINDSVTGLILKYKFNFRNILLTHGSELKREYKFNTRLLIKVILKNSEVIANSNYIKTQILKFGGQNESIRVVNLGVDAKEFYPMSINRKKYLSNIDNNAFVIMTIASLSYYKGIDVCIKAIKLLKSKYQIKYLIIGFGDYESDLKKLSKEMNLEADILFLGKAVNPDLNKYLNLSDIFVLPSRSEGFGISLIEASACRKPIIGSRVGGILDAIIENETGLLFQNESPEDLARQISFLIENEEIRKKLADNAFKRAQNQLSWKEVISKIQIG